MYPNAGDMDVDIAYTQLRERKMAAEDGRKINATLIYNSSSCFSGW